MGKTRLAFAAMSNQDAGHYGKVKVAIFRYDINEETYCQQFHEVTPKENETPVELVIHVQDLVEKCLKGCAYRTAVVDELVKKQFISVLPEEVRVWVKERKPCSIEEAGRLAENYRQARKSDPWAPGVKPKRSNPKCFASQKPGHLAKDCPKKTIPRTLTKGEDATEGDHSTKGEKKKQEDKPWSATNCGGKGHISRQCSSVALYCGAKNPCKSSKSKPLVKKVSRDGRWSICI